MKITREQGEAFVRYGENAYNSFAALKSMVLVFCFLDFIGWMIWAASGRGLGYAVAMTAVTVAYEAGILVLASPRTEKTYRLRFLTNFLCIYAIALEFLLVGLLMCLAADAGSPVWQSLELLVIFLGCPVLCCLYTRHRIGKGVYLGKGSPQKGNVYPWAMGASLLGGLVARLLMPTLDQSQALRLLLWCIEGIFFCISLGAPNILRFHYAGVFGMDCNSKGERVSQLLCKSTKPVRPLVRVGKCLLWTAGLALGIAIVYAVAADR